MRGRPSPSSPRRTRLLVGVCALTAAVLTSGCGFANALAHPATPSYSLPEATVSTATTTPAPPSRVVAAADLVRNSSGGRSDSLTVRVTPVRHGVPIVLTPGGLLTQDCRLDPAATRYVTVSVRLTDYETSGVASNLHLDLATTRGAGIVAVTVNPTDYCHGGATLPVQTSLQSVDLTDNFQTMTVYVLARTSPTDPEPLHGVTLQLRHLTDEVDGALRSWEVQRITAGAPCPGDANSLCVPVSG